MARGDLPALASLTLADAPATWRALGFAVEPDGSCVIGGVRLVLAGPQAGTGLTAWALRAAAPLAPWLDGIATETLPADAPAPEGETHPNGALALDHVVVRTPNLPRTLAALTDAGLEVRRVREASPEVHQAFLWAGDVLVEVAGSPDAAGEGPASLWGLVVVAPDLAPFAALGDGRFGAARPAVQAGRSIAPAAPAAGSSTRLAVMTPHRPA